MSNAADEAWGSFTRQLAQHLTEKTTPNLIEMLGTLRRGVREDAREIARRKDVSRILTRLAALERNVADHEQSIGQLTDLQAELAKHSTSEVGEQDPPAPSEGEEGEVEPDLPNEVKAAMMDLRGAYLETAADRLEKCVRRLQRERDETEKAMHATRRTNAEIGERLTEAETEIAHLRENNERLGGMLDRFGEHVQKRDQQVAHLRREKDKAYTRLESLKWAGEALDAREKETKALRNEIKRLHQKRDEAMTRIESLKAIADREAQLVIDRGDEIQELKSKIAHLSDPENYSPSGEGVACIARERRRQAIKEGWTPEHDDGHGDGAIALAASAYALHAAYDRSPSEAPSFWPWDKYWWKPTSRLRCLEKAGALIAAEIDRLLRAHPPETQEDDDGTG